MNTVELFFNILDYEVLIDAASNKKISINGFKNLRKVPEAILRKNIASRFMNKPSSLSSLLESICYLNIKDIKNNSIEDILYNFLSYPLKNEAPNYVALGILMLNYPEYAESNVNKFYDNIKNNRPIFEGCIKKQEITEENYYEVMGKVLQLYDPIEWFEVYSQNIEYMIEKIEKLDIYNYLCKKFKGLGFYDLCLKFEKLTKKYPDYIISISYIKENIDVIKVTSERDRYFFNKMLFNAYECINIEYFRLNQSKMDESLKQIRYYRGKVKEYEKKILSLKNNYNKLEKEFTQYKNTIQFPDEDENAIEMDCIKKEFKSYECDNMVITSYEYDEVFDCIGKCYILNPKDIYLLDEVLINFKGIVFIDRSSINSTKELLIIEKIIRSKNLKKCVLLAKSKHELVRNIIIKQHVLGGLE